jgi:ribosomal-protein-alanine N-acetyltransferase
VGEKTTVTVDFMKKEDLDQVMAIEDEAFTMPWSRNLFLSEFRNPAVSLMLVALAAASSRIVVGYSVCWVFVDELHILNLATKAEYRRQGIARQLMLETLKRAYDRGARKAFLEVRASNEPAQRLYESMGFTVGPVRKDYYDMPVEDAVVMVLEHGKLMDLLGRMRTE